MPASCYQGALPSKQLNMGKVHFISRTCFVLRAKGTQSCFPLSLDSCSAFVFVICIFLFLGKKVSCNILISVFNFFLPFQQAYNCKCLSNYYAVICNSQYWVYKTCTAWDLTSLYEIWDCWVVLCFTESVLPRKITQSCILEELQ